MSMGQSETSVIKPNRTATRRAAQLLLAGSNGQFIGPNYQAAQIISEYFGMDFS